MPCTQASWEMPDQTIASDYCVTYSEASYCWKLHAWQAQSLCPARLQQFYFRLPHTNRQTVPYVKLHKCLKQLQMRLCGESLLKTKRVPNLLLISRRLLTLGCYNLTAIKTKNLNWLPTLFFAKENRYKECWPINSVLTSTPKGVTI